MALDHVGSTSVPGLPAKPVIDIDLTVADSRDEAAYVPALEAAGFELQIREPRLARAPLLVAATAAGSAAISTDSRTPGTGAPQPAADH